MVDAALFGEATLTVTGLWLAPEGPNVEKLWERSARMSLARKMDIEISKVADLMHRGLLTKSVA